LPVNGEAIQKHAEGGFVSGPGGTDNVRSRLTAGEFIVKRDAAKNNAAILHAINKGPGLADEFQRWK
jgi:hypothetical protein